MPGIGKGGVMGPDTSHAAPLAERITDTIVRILAEHGIARPDGGLVIEGGAKWDAEVEKVSAALREMIELDAADRF